MARGDDLSVVLHCPKCPRLLTYITRVDSGTTVRYVYACSEHGRWCVRPDGRLVPQDNVVH